MAHDVPLKTFGVETFFCLDIPSYSKVFMKKQQVTLKE